MNPKSKSNTKKYQLRKRFTKLWNALRTVDRILLFREKKSFLEQLERNPDEIELCADTFFLKLEHYAQRSLIPHAEKIKCEFPEFLPISSHIKGIREAIRNNKVVIVCGTTGSGKTTQLPKAVLLEGCGRHGRIGCTQPRRIAATSLARRFAYETETGYGHETGYQIRFDDHTDDSTVVKFMTDGILLSEIQNDPKLFQYDCIIIDEVHERTLNIDFLLGYLKLLLQKRQDLKVIISSATLDTERISAFFDNAPIIDVGGRVFPVEDVYLEPDSEEELAETVARGIESLPDDGDILVFLPGEREIRNCTDMLSGRRYPHTKILPLFGRLSATEQELIFSPKSGGRRIILSTNVAETSITIPGIRYIVDSNLVRLSRYNPKSGIQELHIENISRSSAMQRRGRCGRERDGICVHLVSEGQLNDAEEFTPPEIQRASLADVILRMTALKLPPILNFPLVDPPSMQLIQEGMTTLSDLQAIDAAGALTDIGKRLAELPIGPRLGRILLASEDYNVFNEILIIISYLAIQDPKERPFEKTQQADAAQRKFDVDNSDFLSILKIWLAAMESLAVSKSQLRRFCKANYLNFRRMLEWYNLAADILEACDKNISINELKIELRAERTEPIHKSLMSGLPRRLACYDKEKRLYYDRTGRYFAIFPGSALSKIKRQPQWLLCFSIMETSRVFGRCCAEVNGLWLEEIAPSLCSHTYDNIRWNPESGFVTATERVMDGRLLIHPGKTCHYGRINPVEARKVFITQGLVPALIPDTASPWIAEFNRMVRNIRKKEDKLRREGAFLDEDAIFQHFMMCLPPYINSTVSIRQAWDRKKISYCPEPSAIIFGEDDDWHPEDFPEYIEDGDEHYELRYTMNPGEEEDGIRLILPESHLNLISPSLGDYLVPGYLRWKLDYVLRALPKSLRKQLQPLDECAESFMQGLRNGEIYQERNFYRNLASFLRTLRNCSINESDFDSIELPNYLRMKYEITDSNGKTLRILRELTSVDTTPDTISNKHKLAQEWNLTGYQTWPDIMPNLPEKLLLNENKGRTVYPAFFVEERSHSIGCSLFLEHQIAICEHRRAILFLFQLIYPKMFEYMHKQVKLDRDMEYEFFHEEQNWRNVLIENAVTKALKRDLSTIRTNDDFQKARSILCDRLSDAVLHETADLQSLLKSYAPIEVALDDIPRDTYLSEDIDRQLGVLFRRGFLHTPEALKRYPRYLKALKTRIERAKMAYLKDESKGSAIEPMIHKFHVLMNAGCDLENNESFFRFFLLLQEARIAAWTPELPILEKATSKTLQTAFDLIEL